MTFKKAGKAANSRIMAVKVLRENTGDNIL